jgi:hypothetical protein
MNTPGIDHPGYFPDSIFSLSCNKASFIACDSVENRLTFIFSSIQLKSPGSIDTDLLTDKGSFFFGRTINFDNTPKLINNVITITFMVILKITKLVVRRNRRSSNTMQDMRYNTRGCGYGDGAI